MSAADPTTAPPYSDFFLRTLIEKYPQYYLANIRPREKNHPSHDNSLPSPWERPPLHDGRVVSPEEYYHDGPQGAERSTEGGVVALNKVRPQQPQSVQGPPAAAGTGTSTPSDGGYHSMPPLPAEKRTKPHKKKNLPSHAKSKEAWDIEIAAAKKRVEQLEACLALVHEQADSTDPSKIVGFLESVVRSRSSKAAGNGGDEGGLMRSSTPDYSQLLPPPTTTASDDDAAHANVSSSSSYKKLQIAHPSERLTKLPDWRVALIKPTRDYGEGGRSRPMTSCLTPGGGRSGGGGGARQRESSIIQDEGTAIEGDEQRHPQKVMGANQRLYAYHELRDIQPPPPIDRRIKNLTNPSRTPKFSMETVQRIYDHEIASRRRHLQALKDAAAHRDALLRRKKDVRKEAH